MYTININKIDFIYKGKRKKKIITTIKTIDNIPLKELSKKVIEIKRLYREWYYNIEFIKM